MAEIGSLVVDLSARIAGFEANMNKANAQMKKSQTLMNRSLSRIEQGFSKLGKRIGVFAGAAGATLAAKAFGTMSDQAIAFGDDLAKQADRIGVSVEALQELRFAAERAGVSMENADGGLTKFVKTVGEARAGTGSLFTILKKVDPNLLNDLTQTGSVEEALSVMLTHLEGVENAMDRNAIAAAAFGRKAGSAFGVAAGDIIDLREKLKSIGGVLDERLARKAEVAADSLTDLDTTLRVKLHSTVLDNVDGMISFRTLLNDIKIFSIKAAAGVGKLADSYKRFMKIRVSDEVGDLKTLYDDLGKSAEFYRQRVEKLFNEKDSIFPGINQSRQKAYADNLKKLLEIETRRASLLKEINGLEAIETPEKKDDTGGNNDPDYSHLKVPGLPTLKSDAMANESEKMQDRINQIVIGARTPLQALKDELREIQELQPFADTPEKVAGLAAAAEQVHSQIADLTKGTRDWESASVRAALRIGDAFAGAIVYGDNLLKSLMRIAQQAAFTKISGFFGNSILSGLGLAGARADGGPVSAGQSYLVGERGPEIFTPSISGAIIPNGAGGGDSIVVHQTNRFDVSLESVQKMISESTPAIAAGTYEAIAKVRNRSKYA